jgi:hypothetical protein
MSSSLSGWLTLNKDLCGLACTNGVCSSAAVALGQFRNIKASILMGDSNGIPSPMPAACATAGACTVTVGWSGQDFLPHQSDPKAIQWGSWFTIDLPMTIQTITRINLEFMVSADAAWNGTIYVDNISVH